MAYMGVHVCHKHIFYDGGNTFSHINMGTFGAHTNIIHINSLSVFKCG